MTQVDAQIPCRSRTGGGRAIASDAAADVDDVPRCTAGVLSVGASHEGEEEDRQRQRQQQQQQ